MSSDTKKKSEGCYVFTAIGAFIVIAIFERFWPNVIPFKMFEFWTLKGSLSDIVRSCWPLFAWGIGVSIIFALRGRNDPDLNRKAEVILGVGFLISMWAGVAEEIAFRWLIFYDQIIAYKISNWLFFGWARFGLFERFYTRNTGPIANIFNFG